MMLMCSCQGTSLWFHKKYLADTGNGGGGGGVGRGEGAT